MVNKVSKPNNTELLKWNEEFTKKWQSKFDKAQKVIDSEVLRRCEPYIPLITGNLIKSGIAGTVIGSGEVIWLASYAKKVYYNPNATIGRPTGPLRGRYWFERMKTDHLETIIKKVKTAYGE